MSVLKAKRKASQFEHQLYRRLIVNLQIGDDAMAKLNTKIVMLKGEQGKDGTTIKSVEKSASDGLTE